MEYSVLRRPARLDSKESYRWRNRQTHNTPLSGLAWLSLLAPGWATPSPGSLVALSRNRHSESGLAVTAIAEEVQARLLAGSLEVQESPEESVQLPYPSHPG